MSAERIKKSSLLSSILKALGLPFVIFVIGYLYALQLDKEFQVERQIQVQKAVEERLERVSEGVAERVTFYSRGISSLKAAISAFGTDNLNYAFMYNYAESQDYRTKYPGARGLGFIKRVAHSDITSFVPQAASDRPDNVFSVTTLTPHSNSAYIIQYIMPEEVNLQAIGLDIGSETMRRTSADMASQTNSVQLTAPITLVQADNKAYQGFLILQPVFKSVSPPQDEQQRLDATVGWTYAPLLIEEVLSSLSSLRGDVQLTITDIKHSSDTPFFVSTSESVLTGYSASQTLPLFGRVWQLTLTADEGFVANLPLPKQNQAFTNAMVVVIILMLIAFSVQLIINRQNEEKEFKRKLILANQEALKTHNERLEREVEARTQAMVKSTVLQKSILKGAGYALIATDEEGIITVFNPAAEKLLGYSAEEMLHKHTPATFHLEDEVVERAQLLSNEIGDTIAPGFEVFVFKARQGNTDTKRWTYVRKDGSQVPIKLSVTALQDESGQLFGFLGIAYDLSEQLAREHELRLAKEQAERANEAKSRFLANMSHEIRTPMNGVYGALQVLKEAVVDSKEKGLINTAIHSCRALTTIINDILDFSKIEAGKLVIEERPFQLSALLDSLEADLNIMRGKKPIELSFTNQTTHDVWTGDAVRINQIMLNIGSNAIKFTDHGKVSIQVKQTADNTLKFFITDTGIGMSKAALESLFKRFEQADTSTTRKYGGTGLGMAITDSLVKLMNGDIKVVSTPGQGTKFIVSIPLVPSIEEPLDASASESEEQPSTLKGSILVAEDNEINRTVIEVMLDRDGLTLHFAENGKRAVELVSEVNPDLILMDIQMPEMDGIEACKIIKSSHPHIPIIAVTANAMTTDISLYESVGFDNYLAKPVDIDMLYSAIGEHLNS